MSLFLTAGEHVFGVQLFAPVLLFLLNSNGAFSKELCSQHGTSLLALPRTRAVGKAAPGKGIPSLRSPSPVLPVRRLSKLSMPATKSCRSSFFPVPSWQELHLSSVNLSFLLLLQHHCQTPRPNSPWDYLPSMDWEMHCPPTHLQHLNPQRDKKKYNKCCLLDDLASGQEGIRWWLGWELPPPPTSGGGWCLGEWGDPIYPNCSFLNKALLQQQWGCRDICHTVGAKSAEQGKPRFPGIF